MRTQRDNGLLHSGLRVLHPRCNSSVRVCATTKVPLPGETRLRVIKCNSSVLHSPVSPRGDVTCENAAYVRTRPPAPNLLHPHARHPQKEAESDNVEDRNMSVGTDPWSYLVLAAVGVAILYSRRKTRPTSADDSLEPAVAEEPTPTVPVLRRLDVVTVRCEHLDHHPGHAPTAVLTRAHSSRDLRALRRLGWGGGDHTCLCRYHNPAVQVPLDKIHVLCDAGCGERDVLRTSDPESEFGRLAARGWINTDEGAVWCPYCSGNRDRPRW